MRVILLCIVLGLSLTVLAQTPQAFKYQAVARDTEGNPLVNQDISLKVSILSGSPNGTAVYSELHSVFTNDLGLFSLEIGNPGLVLSGTFTGINWAEGTYFMKLEIDPAGGLSFQLMGTTQLLSVPYALYAENVMHNDDADADPSNELQTLSQNGNQITLSNGGGTVNVSGIDNDTLNEIQQLNKNGNVVTLSKNGGSFTDENTIYQAGSGLQLDGTTFNNTAPDQTVSILAGNGISRTGTYPSFTITNTKPDQTVILQGTGAASISGIYPNFTVYSNPNDTSAVNEIQVLNKVGSTVSLSKSGGSFVDDNTTYSAGSGLQLTGTTFSNTAPDQTVSISAGTGITRSGTYPNFTISNSAPDQTVSIIAGIGITKSGTYPNFTITNNLPDQIVTIGATGAANVSGTYPNFLINANPTDTSATNELQQISKEGNVVTLSKQGGSFTDENTTYQPGTGLTLSGTTFNSVWTENSGNISSNNSGNVGIGTSTPNPSALLELSSNSKGFLPPRLTNDQMNAIENPEEGLMIYNLTTNEPCFYNGDFWVCSGTEEHKNCGEVTYEGQLYHTVIIGNQCWMKENLNVGTKISGSSNQSNNGVIEKYCYTNDNNDCNTYGGLYQWNEMMNYSIVAGIQGICPAGWHLPTFVEWVELASFLGGESIAGGKMKSIDRWDSPNTGATNSSGFSALPGGCRVTNGNFSQATEAGYFWSSTEDNSPNTDSYYTYLHYSVASVEHDDSSNKYYGYSVRCLKDN